MKRTILISALLLSTLAPLVQAQTQTQTLNTVQNSTLNINTAPDQTNGFVLKVCDGPDLSQLPTGSQVYVDINGNSSQVTITNGQNPSGYIPCDFNGAIIQIQRLINAMIILGVFLSIIAFCYAGYLYVTGTPGNISKAHGIFKDVAIGFIIMLSAWFIVYQILTWLTGGNSPATALLK